MQANSAHLKGLTLIELLLVIAIISVLVIPLLLTYQGYRTSQALLASAEAVANHARSAHVFAREARNSREWGIKSINNYQYSIYSLGASGERLEYNYFLENRVFFVNDFNVLFKIGTGETDSNFDVELVNTNGSKAQVKISKFGLVEVLRE